MSDGSDSSGAEAPSAEAGALPGWGLLAALVGYRLVLLIAFGPLRCPDTSGYEAFAEQVLASGAWLGDAGLSATAPITCFRSATSPRPPRSWWSPPCRS